MLSFCGGVVVGWGLHSHFHVQPNCCVEVVLSLWLCQQVWFKCAVTESRIRVEELYGDGITPLKT